MHYGKVQIKAPSIFVTESRDIFRTLSNNYDETLCENNQQSKNVNYFSQKIPITYVCQVPKYAFASSKKKKKKKLAEYIRSSQQEDIIGQEVQEISIYCRGATRDFEGQGRLTPTLGGSSKVKGGRFFQK